MQVEDQKTSSDVAEEGATGTPEVMPDLVRRYVDDPEGEKSEQFLSEMQASATKFVRAFHKLSNK